MPTPEVRCCPWFPLEALRYEWGVTDWGCLRVTYAACVFAGMSRGPCLVAVWDACRASPPGRWDRPIRQQARELSLRLLINLSVPSLDRCKPSSDKSSSFRSPFLHRKLSWLDTNTHPLLVAISLIFSFTAFDFSAATGLSTRGVMLLKVMCPVDDTLFASVTMALIFEAILSIGNLVEQSFVPTWILMSAWAFSFMSFINFNYMRKCLLEY